MRGLSSNRTLGGIFRFGLCVSVVLIAYATGKVQAQDKVQCAKEGERCVFEGTAEVAYGAGDRWATKVATSSIQCGVAGFGGDPAPNVLKTCQLTTKRCAREGGKCDFSGVRTVNYGANGIFASRNFRDGVTCGVAAFGYDPVPDVFKQCFIGPAPEKPINEITWLGTHNAIASTYYGFITQQSQRDSVTSQLDRGARALEIDIVQDTPYGFGTGVYVCHCGKAPHSISEEEVRRFASGKSTQTFFPIQIAGWTHPTPYTRFSTTLKEIDKWMIANPGEIVIVLLENNSANGAQLDAEIAAARLQTGIYTRKDDTKWPTRSELVRSNKRLILQIGDDFNRVLPRRGSAGESKYATAKFKIETITEGGRLVNKEVELLKYADLTPPAYGNLNHYSKDLADDARAGNKLLVIGAFNSSLTDETTARAHNNYAFLNSAKKVWEGTKQARTFYPSVIQVNQIHIGDALRFVNDINGGPYMIPSKHDTIGDTSGDSWQLRFENNAAFNAGIVVMYFEDTVVAGNTVAFPKVIQSGVLNPVLGVARMVNLPRKMSAGKPITVWVKLYSIGEFELYKEELPANFVGSPVPCFKATGILTSPKGSRCE